MSCIYVVKGGCGGVTILNKLRRIPIMLYMELAVVRKPSTETLDDLTAVGCVCGQCRMITQGFLGLLL